MLWVIRPTVAQTNFYTKVSNKTRKPTLEEMVEDLQRSSRERRDGENDPKLVVRSDGSEMMKVRKRKRRSKQPGKEAAKKRRKVRFAFVAAGVVLVAMGCLGLVVTYGYHNSQSFQDKVAQTVKGQTGSEVKLGSLSVGVTSAQLDEVSLSWDSAQGAVTQLNLQKVTASYGIGGFFGGEWRLSGIDAFEGQMVLRNTDTPALPINSSQLVKYSNDFIHCSKMNIFFGEMGRVANIENADTTLKFYKSTEPIHLSLNGGKFNLKHLEGLQIENALIKLYEGKGDMYLRLTDDEKYGSMVLEGMVPLNTEKRAKLDAKLESFPIQKLLAAKTQRFFQGRISSQDAVLDLKPDELGEFSCKGTFTSNSFRINGFPFLRTLSEMLGNNWYLRPVFNRNISGEMERVGNKLYINNFTARDNKYLKLDGHLMIEEDGSIKGEFKVSIPEESANFRSRAPKGLFTRPYDGYVSTVVKISGSVHDVQDDFQSRVDELRSQDTETPKHTEEEVVPAPQQPEKSDDSSQKNKQIEKEFFDK